MKLTEGFDCPDIKTVWVRDSGKGTTTQMAGRVFRIHPDLPVKQVVQSKVTRWPCLKTAMPKIQYSYENGEWMSLTINPKIDEMTHNSRRAIASAVVDIPAYILNKQAKGRRKPRATERVI
jgi:superfamily II DNA or RNA helicase